MRHDPQAGPGRLPTRWKPLPRVLVAHRARDHHVLALLPYWRRSAPALGSERRRRRLDLGRPVHVLRREVDERLADHLLRRRRVAGGRGTWSERGDRSRHDAADRERDYCESDSVHLLTLVHWGSLLID